MAKRISGLVLAVLLLVGLFLLFTVYFAYEEEEDVSGFPVPKSADLTKADESVAVYEWTRASEENGIPFFYKLAIKSKGWTLVDQEGASSYYEREGSRIDLISQTDLLTIRVEE